MKNNQMKPAKPTKRPRGRPPGRIKRKINITLDENIWSWARNAATELDTSLSALVESSLTRALKDIYRVNDTQTRKGIA
jgi:hypothetical protein